MHFFVQFIRIFGMEFLDFEQLVYNKGYFAENVKFSKPLWLLSVSEFEWVKIESLWILNFLEIFEKIFDGRVFLETKIT